MTLFTRTLANSLINKSIIMKAIKIFLMIMVVSALSSSIKAQTLNAKYQGEVSAGYSIGIGTFSYDRMNIHTVHGVRFNKYFFAGVGLGLDYYYNYDLYINTYIESDGELTMPIFANAKGYLPISDKTSIFASLDLGVGVGLTEGVSEVKGLLITPAIGISFKVSSKNAINFSVGYNYQDWSENAIDINTDAISLKLGFQF